MQHMQDLNRFTAEAIEDQIVAIGSAADAKRLIPRHRRVAFGCVGQRFASAPKLGDEGEGARWTVLCDPVGDALEITFCRRGDDDDHRACDRSLAFSMARYLASSRSNTVASGFTRPASTSARPRAMAASSAASRNSRS